MEEEVSLHAVTKDGIALSLMASWRLHALKDRHRLEVLGSEGSAQLTPLTVYKQVGGRTVDVTPRQPIPRGGEDHFTSGYRRLLDEFVRVVAGNARARTLDDQVALMALVESAYRSAEEGGEARLA